MDQLLKNRDYTFILAREASPSAFAPPGLKRQWRIAEKSILAIARHCEELDANGLNIYLATNPYQKLAQTNSNTLLLLFEDSYATPEVHLLEALQAAIADYFQHQQNKKTPSNGDIILVILDGEPTHQREIVKLLVETTQKIDDPNSLGIMFAEVGDNPMVRGFLQSLDDDLAIAGAKFDLVDTKILGNLAPDDIENFLLNSIFN
jgi:hypothetical protein